MSAAHGPVVRVAGVTESFAIARLHLRSAVAGYGHIFPPEAPPPTEAELLAQWERWIGDDAELGRRVFVADRRGTPLGVVLAGPDLDERTAGRAGRPRSGHLARLYVAPERWGEGIGRQLYDAAISHLEEAGFDRVTLWVLEANDRARSWYERLGWRETGVRKAAYAPAGIDDVGYELTLRVAAP